MACATDDHINKKLKLDGTPDTLAIGEAVETVLRPRDEDITFRLFTNDGSMHSSLALIALKNIFSKQLPKMPKEYIVRLVFDRRHYTLAIMHKGKVIGGCCYRPYYDQRFAEIAFLAINGTEQIKGYGTLLMNHLKNHVQKDGIEYFLTYADNFAIGYFQKQGFSKQVVMPKDRWVGFIKDYDGGTLMECFIHQKVDFLRGPEIIAKQRAFIYERLRARTVESDNTASTGIYSSSADTYEGLELFKEGKRLKNALDAPGVASAGWKLSHFHKPPGAITVMYGSSGSSSAHSAERERDAFQSKLNTTLKSLLDKVILSPHSWPFKETVSKEEYPEYYELIKDPVDLRMINDRLREGDYYRSREMMYQDLDRMTANCQLFNAPDSEYHITSVQLRAEINDLFPDVVALLQARALLEEKKQAAKPA